MLFFTQCFGAVLDLIHLRFQHYKAKRVFAAAGQLVCVVNPTHNLKVSLVLSVTACCLPDWQNSWSEGPVSFPGAVSLRAGSEGRVAEGEGGVLF
ncbi:seven in absentia homolog 3 [Lynx pardinus]|uniref:Seven in absentia homolog 3 n=1 Tax=Lynx pardinus TaxID=191816 RepID=A0A485P1V5_LYNPA|nr:seven in absentia homolog 3 [Lynx pardinus]